MPSSEIQKRIKQQKPFRSDGVKAAFGLLIVADELRRSWAGVVKQGGFTAQQYNVLRILRGAGPAGLPTREVATRLVEKSPGITRLMDVLAAQGFIQRSRFKRDRRAIVCTITPAGLAALRKLDTVVNDWDDRCLSMLTRKETAQLIGLLEAIIRKQTKPNR
jgi:DNA-binding MarR family transcriptional regulator